MTWSRMPSVGGLGSMKSTIQEVTMKAQITTSLDGAGFKRQAEVHLPAITSWGGRTFSAARTEESWQLGETTLVVTYDLRDKLTRFSYTDGHYKNGGASVNLRRTKRNNLITTHASLRELLLRTIDELAIGCTYMCELRDGEVVWVRHSDDAPSTGIDAIDNGYES